MKIRTTLFVAFLLAALVPSTLLAVWSYHYGVQREFSEVKDRHLLLAQSLKGTLERYHKNLVGTVESISTSLLDERFPPNLQQLMNNVNLLCVFIIDEASGETLAWTTAKPGGQVKVLSQNFLKVAQSISVQNKTVFSPVMENENTGNVILGARRHGRLLAVSLVKTDFFVALAKSISFGERGHAAIIDSAGNLLAHPLPEWVEQRRNIAKVAIAQKMMEGESGIQTFYSPALQGDMIAGYATLGQPAIWGVMIPQPVSEIYAKVRENNRALLVTLAIALLIALSFVLIFVNSLAAPLEHFLSVMKNNAKHRHVNEAHAANGVLPLSEIREFNTSYNVMAKRITAANARIAELAYFDIVTGLPNRVKLEHYADRFFNHPTHSDQGGIFAYIDIDNFKQINDLFTHSIGDIFLRDTARKIREVVATAKLKQKSTANSRTGAVEEPMVARIGGDEFAVMFPGMTTARETEDFLSELNVALTRQGSELPIVKGQGASIGCSEFPTDGNRLSELLKRADIAMYHAKRAGKNRHQLFNAELGALNGSDMTKAVSAAIDAGEMNLEYQPKICARTNTVSGVEALVRWDSREHGRIMPDQWIPSLARTPVMSKLGEWVIARAMDDQLRWSHEGLTLKVAVNIGAEHFEETGFGEWLQSKALSRGYNPQHLEIELTENTLFSSSAAAEETLRNLTEFGFKISIDDFGTGHSNIARLSQLSIDSLKIDRSIISNAHKDEKMASIMECIVMMANRLGVETVAEGIENEEQKSYCTALGVHELQGYYFARSMAWADVLNWVHDFHSTTVPYKKKSSNPGSSGSNHRVADLASS